MRGKIAVLAFIAAVGAPWSLVAETSPARSVEDFIRAFERSYRDVRSLRAEFTQTYVWGGRRRVESGSVVFARGGKMRWDYVRPGEKIFLSDGKRAILFVPEDKQLTHTSVKESDDLRIPFRLLLSRPNLRRVFGRIVFGEGVEPSDPANTVLRALPKPEHEDVYREVQIEVTPQYDIRRLVIYYPDRSTMEFVFEGIARNVSVSPALFRLVPPPDVQIIEQP
jgi:outer membrane lipoprotein carrier protein